MLNAGSFDRQEIMIPSLVYENIYKYEITSVIITVIFIITHNDCTGDGRLIASYCLKCGFNPYLGPTLCVITNYCSQSEYFLSPFNECL